MSSMNELLLLRIEGAREALEEPYRESLGAVFRLGRCENTAGPGFSVMTVDDCGGRAAAAGGADLPDLPALK